MSVRAGRGLRMIVLALVAGGVIAPVVAGLSQTVLAALGHLPSAGHAGLTLAAFRDLAALPGLWTALRLSLVTGLAGTLLAFLLALALVFGGGRVRGLAVPLLAAPHAALAVGLALMIAPSGWIARLAGFALTGWRQPPDIASLHDPAGLALILGLAVKELPFLWLVMQVGLTRLPVAAHMAQGRSLGHGPGVAWLAGVLPPLYRLIRLPLFVVLAYATSTVDMAIVLGPSNPPPLSVLVLRLASQPDVGAITGAAAAGLVQAALAGSAILIWWAGERLVAALGLGWLQLGGPPLPSAVRILPNLLLWLGQCALALGLAALALLLLWSLAARWPFPDPWPDGLSLSAWMHPGQGWGPAALQTLALGLITSLMSLLLAVLWLEGEDRGQLPRAPWAEALVYLPLILPQVTFLFGLHVMALRFGPGTGPLAVIWGQVLFVFPYVLLSLSEAWRALDPRFARTAAALGAGPWRRLAMVKLPCLMAPLLTAAAIGFAVSVAQYLPTLVLGGGRIATLTTEAVALSSGADRRLLAVMASLQAALPLAAYGLALTVPPLAFRNRRGLRGGRA